jgi:ABC-2 type transport system permease protein
MPEGNIDMGSTIGSYAGLMLLISAYSSIGIFTSTLSDNQIVAFILSVFLCFFFYFGFEGLSSLTPLFSTIIAAFGMQDHFKSMDGCDRYQRRAIFCEYNNTIPFVYCL